MAMPGTHWGCWRSSRATRRQRSAASLEGSSPTVCPFPTRACLAIRLNIHGGNFPLLLDTRVASEDLDMAGMMCLLAARRQCHIELRGSSSLLGGVVMAPTPLLHAIS